MKKISLLLALSIIFALASCGDTVGQSSVLDDDTVTSSGDTVASSSDDSVSSTEELAFENIALNKQVYASSYNSTLSMITANAVDGDEETSWCSDSASKSIDEWIVVDLGQNYNISAVNVKWGKSYSPSFAIEYSRGGAEFTELFSTTEGDGNDTLASAEDAIGRYVRVRCKSVVSVMGTYMGATIQEIEVAGTVADDQTLGKETGTMVITKAVSIEENDVLRGGRSYSYKTLAAAGATFEYQCTGRAAGAVIKGDYGRFEVSVDGGAYKSFQIKKGTHEYLFTDKLDDGVHTVRITRQSESWDPLFSVEQILVEKDSDIVKGYKGNYNLKIEFVGDSLTSAQGVDYSQSYVVEAARILNAHFQVISRGGMGIYRNHDNSTYGTLPTYYEYTEYQNPKSDKPYTYDADIVVFNMGGNDAVCQMLYHNTPSAQAEYVAEYEKLYYEMLDEVFTANPNAFVVCCYGQLGSATPVFNVIKDIVARYEAAHPDRRIEVFEFKMAIDFTVTNDGHPGPKSHKRDGEMLAEKIKEYLGK